MNVGQLHLLFNTPVLLHPHKAQPLIRAASAGLAGLVDEDGEITTPSRRYRGEDKGYDVIAGVAVIEVTGILLQKTGYLRPVFDYFTGYDGIRQAFLTAVVDPEVRSIVLVVASPGGLVDGCFDLADEIYGMRGVKPIAAILNENAFSAAYAIACAVDPGRIYVPRTGGTGSIGVMQLHYDISGMLDKQGVKPTAVTTGDKKADGYPEFPLSAAAIADMQAEVDAVGEIFFDTVARNRGLAASVVRGFEAACFLGANGIRAGLADTLLSPDLAFQALLAELA